MDNNVIKYDEVKETYLSFIKETLILVKNLIENTKSVPYHPNDRNFFRARAKHIQAMSFMGLVGEHLIKIILLKRGYVINEIKSARQLSQDDKNKLVVDKFRLISFSRAVEIFKRDLGNDYYAEIKDKKYIINPYPDIYDKYSYFGEKIINSEKCIDLIVKIRNSYLHFASAQGEQNGIIWYVYNFLIWLAKKEFNEEFSDLEYIGNKDAKSLWSK
jgi:hypothetical protein